MGDLEGKVAVITGGARGIGRGIAECMHREGATVVITDIDFDVAQATAAELGGKAVALHHDVRDEQSSVAVAKTALDRFGKVEILLNNAGVGPNPGPLETISEAEYDRVMDINAKGLFLVTKAFVPVLKRNPSGRVINISSIVGQSGFAMVLPYIASKFAVVGMTHTMAHELAPHNITVNSIHPGILATDLHSGVVSKFSKLMNQPEQATWDWFKSRIPLSRFQTPTDVGEMAAFIASDRAHNITGAAFNVDGGWEMH